MNQWRPTEGITTPWQRQIVLRTGGRPLDGCLRSAKFRRVHEPAADRLVGGPVLVMLASPTDDPPSGQISAILSPRATRDKDNRANCQGEGKRAGGAEPREREASREAGLCPAMSCFPAGEQPLSFRFSALAARFPDFVPNGSSSESKKAKGVCGFPNRFQRTFGMGRPKAGGRPDPCEKCFPGQS